MQKVSSQFKALSANNKRRKTLVSLTPLIDVVFILLVFFMLASSFSKWQTIKIDSSNNHAESTVKADLPPFLVQVATNKLMLNNKDIALSSLLEKAKAKPDDQVVILQPLADTPVQALIDILDALNEQTIAPLQLTHDPSWQLSKRTQKNVSQSLEER